MALLYNFSFSFISSRSFYVSWKLPQFGWIKLNFNGSVMDNGSTIYTNFITKVAIKPFAVWGHIQLYNHTVPFPGLRTSWKSSSLYLKYFLASSTKQIEILRQCSNGCCLKNQLLYSSMLDGYLRHACCLLSSLDLIHTRRQPFCGSTNQCRLKYPCNKFLEQCNN